MKSCTVDRGCTPAPKDTTKLAVFFRFFSSRSFYISIKNSVQRWSSDFQALFRVKIRKMAHGSKDFSTLPKSKPPKALFTIIPFGLSWIKSRFVAFWRALQHQSVPKFRYERLALDHTSSPGNERADPSDWVWSPSMRTSRLDADGRQLFPAQSLSCLIPCDTPQVNWGIAIFLCHICFLYSSSTL